MTTTGQISDFVKQWNGAAQAAGKSLGIPASFILSQWGMESGWGTQPNMGKYNPGNVGNLGGGRWQDYSNAQDFVNAYVGAVKNDFPMFSPSNHTKLHNLLGETNVQYGVPTSYTIQQIFNGKNSYDPSNTTYGNNVVGAYSSLLKATGQNNTTIDNWLQGQSTPLIGIKDGASGVTETPSQAANNAVASLTSGLGQTITDVADKAGIILLGALAFIAGLFILVKNDLPTPTNIVEHIKEGDGE